MPFSSNNIPERDAVLSRYFPHYRPAAEGQSGLSGGSVIIESPTQRLVLRRHHDPDAPQAVFYASIMLYRGFLKALRRSRVFT